MCEETCKEQEGIVGEGGLSQSEGTCVKLPKNKQQHFIQRK